MITSDKPAENLNLFELDLFLEKELCKEDHSLETLPGTGRGNPSWTAPTPRKVFLLSDQFATKEILRGGNERVAGMAQLNFGRT